MKTFIIFKWIILKTSPLNTEIPPKIRKFPHFFSPQKNKNPPKKYKKNPKNTKMAPPFFHPKNPPKKYKKDLK
jgi:hypothetical protein